MQCGAVNYLMTACGAVLVAVAFLGLRRSAVAVTFWPLRCGRCKKSGTAVRSQFWWPRRALEAIAICRDLPSLNRDQGWDLPPIFNSLLSHDLTIGGHVTSWATSDIRWRPWEMAKSSMVSPRNRPLCDGNYVKTFCVYETWHFQQECGNFL